MRFDDNIIGSILPLPKVSDVLTLDEYDEFLAAKARRINLEILEKLKVIRDNQ